jgi:hypothetical protein
MSAKTSFLIPSSDIDLFGILTSAMRMAWVRTLGGRLESGERHSGVMVYTAFCYLHPTPDHRARVDEKARAVLAARHHSRTCADALELLFLVAARLSEGKSACGGRQGEGAADRVNAELGRGTDHRRQRVES